MKDSWISKGRLIWPLGLGFLWLLFLLVLAVWSVRAERAHVVAMAEREAKAFFQQVVVTRAWNAAHGGVYVLATPENPPNPYLKEDERVLETVQGVTLTKINPAYMTRQISSIAQNDHEVQFHITSLDPIRPGNQADQWEAGALQAFNRGEKERFEMVGAGDGQVFRYMAPLYAEQRCMRCHADYGHASKKILGGISVSFAAAPLVEARKSSVAQTHIAFTLIFLVGFVGICGSTYQVQKKREEAERANRTKSVFLANMSHDMRTPLNGIMGMTELMQRNGLGRNQSRYADMVHHSARTLLEIVTDITDFSRLESGRLELSSQPFDIRALVDDTLSIFQYEAGTKGIVLTGEVGEDVPRVLTGDGFRLKQVVANLVGNAVKFTDQGGVGVAVSLDPKPLPKGAPDNAVRLRVAVEDTGIGIPDEVQKDIFESFRQVDDSYAKQHEGTGLGLAICKELVTMMGGTIGVESGHGVGSTFSFDVVLSIAEDAPAAPGEARLTGEAVQAAAPAKVLVAEDNAVNQTFAREILEGAGHTAVIAENGREALEHLAREPFDVVFMDVQMPELDGLEATRRIRAGEVGEAVRNVPIIAATAFAVAGDKQACLDAGMTGFVVKPLKGSDLLEAVARHTGGDMEQIEEQPAAPRPVPAAIDVDEAMERLGGRRELYDKLATIFVEDTPPKVSALRELFEAGDMKEVLRLAHGLKNSAGIIGAADMAGVCQGLEVAVREERFTEIPERIDEVEGAAGSALAGVQRILEA